MTGDRARDLDARGEGNVRGGGARENATPGANGNWQRQGARHSREHRGSRQQVTFEAQADAPPAPTAARS